MNVSALDENGKRVDFWFIYKVPRLNAGANNDSATGYEYVYFDPNRPKVEKSPHLLDRGKGALNLTLDFVFNKPAATIGWILLYNDELPASVRERDNNNLGHTKGVIAFDTATRPLIGCFIRGLNLPTPMRLKIRPRCMGRLTCASPLTLPPPATSPRRWPTTRNHRSISPALPTCPRPILFFF